MVKAETRRIWLQYFLMLPGWHYRIRDRLSYARSRHDTLFVRKWLLERDKAAESTPYVVLTMVH
jgi:hypothetical protein